MSATSSAAPASGGPRRAVSFADPARRPPSHIALAKGESLVLSARVLPGESLLVRVDGREVARSLPIEGALGSVLVAHESLTVAPFAVARVDLVACASSERAIDSIAVVDARGLKWASALSIVAALAPATLALLALVASRSITAKSLFVQLIEASLVALSLALAVRRWSGRVRFVARFDARIAAVCAVLAWTLFFAARSQNLVVHNLTGRPSFAGRVPAGRSSWLRAEYGAIANASSACGNAGPLCLVDDPRALVPEACGAVPEEEPLVRLHHAVRFLGCPSRYEAVDAAWLRDTRECAQPLRSGRCCFDLRGERCSTPRSIQLEIPWPNGVAERARDPRCPTRELLPWRVQTTQSVGASERIAALRNASVSGELCVDLERWGSAHEIIIEHEGSVWRAARAPDARPRALRVALPALPNPERARVRIAYTVSEGEGAPVLQGSDAFDGVRAGHRLPSALRFEAQPGDSARAALAAISLGERERDALAKTELVVRDGQPALHAELWPGLACGTSVSIIDPSGASLGESALPCAPPGHREHDDEPWVLWRFALREAMPDAWREAARTLTDQLGGGAVRFRSERVPSEVFLAFRGWDAVSIDLRVYSREPRTMGIEPVGEVMRGRVSAWRMFAGPPPPRDALCCQLDGVWSTCPAEFNDYWRCQGTIAGRPGCTDAYRRCTFIDWAVERAARREAGARSSGP